MKNCDNCSVFFQTGDSILTQKSNELGKSMRLDFCNEDCLKNSKENYPFLNPFKFEIEIINNEQNHVIDPNMIYIVTNFYELIFENGEAKKSLRTIKEYIDLRNKQPDNITQKELEYINFMKDIGFINM
jgi:hypothetical protein